MVLIIISWWWKIPKLSIIIATLFLKTLEIFFNNACMLDWVCQTNEKLRNSIPSLHSEIFKKECHISNHIWHLLLSNFDEIWTRAGQELKEFWLTLLPGLWSPPEMTSFIVRFDPTTDSMIQLENKFRTKWNRILELLSQGKSPECN